VADLDGKLRPVAESLLEPGEPDGEPSSLPPERIADARAGSGGGGWPAARSSAEAWQRLALGLHAMPPAAEAFSRASPSLKSSPQEQ
jgi:hypothetical protein